MNSRPATFATLLSTAYAAHQLADHVLGQTDAQAAAKALPGRAGWTALARHVGAYHAVMGGMVAVTARSVGLPVTGRGLAASLAVSAATHAVWDRRRPVAWLMTRAGSPGYAGMTIKTDPDGIPWQPGLIAADQALHTACLWAAALVTVAVSGRD